MTLPKDPIILLSYINTKLRDEFSSLDELCKSLDIDRSKLEKILSSIHYTYNEKRNQFNPQI
ncbi:DUF4250 domain-containing protein [Mobilitalea sibirica]|uniref:DUF4250 domain-containing protein n=1 Tax=Mobilitalea sibirica TaxID=1462919 RepID=A0A8J7KWE0_9FIRM|nr:DUF4250 domain-containing protein [Mobilitalea sibirica]MBH1940302.1 DUF4250 domain-containing protein [Mobilitalea sibirica]